MITAPALLMLAAFVIKGALGKDPFALQPQSPACDEGPAIAAFASGDISQARATLASYKDKSPVERECAVQVWKHGIAEFVNKLDDFASLTSDASYTSDGSRFFARHGRSGCDAKVEDGTWLNIPRLQEVVICIHVGGGIIVLEQDGFLRAFDMPTVLWPAGFFLTSWVTRNCQVLTGRILELGAGVGAPSIAASMCGDNTVLATDSARHGLVNVWTNAQINQVNVRAQVFDWNNETHADSIAKYGSFDVILGAGLAPHRWTEQTWSLLSRLLQPRTGRVMLCQGVGDVEVSNGFAGNGTFVVKEVVPGDKYGLHTRWGADSEFEVVILQHAKFEEL